MSKPTIFAQARVRCSGGMHRVVVMSNGAICLPNHTRGELRSAAAMTALGADRCRCLDVRDAATRFVRRTRLAKSKVPPALANALIALRAHAAEQRKLGHGARADFAWSGASSLRERLEDRRWAASVLRAREVSDALDSACCDALRETYRGGRSSWVECGSKYDVRGMEHDFSVCGNSERVWHKKHQWSAQRLFLYVRYVLDQAYAALQACGCRAVDSAGHPYPVVALVTEGAVTYAVTGRQAARGIGVNPCRAVVKLGARGEPAKIVRWEK